MNTPWLILLPAAEGDALPWALWRDGTLVATGAGSDVADAIAALDEAPRIAAIIPAADAPLYRIELADLPLAQARAAALLIAAENAAAPLDTLHVALGPVEDDGTRMAAVTAKARMHGWIARCRAAGFDPRRIVPASALLPEPAEGFAAAEIMAERVLRGRDCAMVDEPAMRLIVGGAPVAETNLPPLDAAIESAAVNLAQGPFAPRRRVKIDWRRLRRVALFVALAGLFWVAAAVADVIKLNAATTALKARAAAAAAPLLAGQPITDPAAQLRRAAAERGDGSAALLAAMAAVQRALADTPDAALTGIAWTGDGTLDASLRAPAPEAIAAVTAAIRAQGFAVTTAPPQNAVDGVRAELRISR